MKKEQRSKKLLWIYSSIVASATSLMIIFYMIIPKVAQAKFPTGLLVSVAGVVVGMASALVAILFYTQIIGKRIKAFISFTNDDLEKTKKIKEFLRHKRILVVEPETSVKIGDDIAKSIFKAIETSDCLIIILSKKTSNSQWAQKELDFALANKKKVYPVLVEEADIPEQLTSIKFADFRTGKYDDLGRLVYAIRENFAK